MGLFSGNADKRRARRFRKACEREISQHYAPLRKRYVGRSFSMQGKDVLHVVKVDRIDDEGDVLLLSCRPGYHLLYMAVLSWDDFARLLSDGRMVAV